jgi:FkbM family methyltransferase
MYFLSKVLEPGGTFIDVGANIGLYSLAAARIVGSGGRVLAFEPSSRERELLERNIDRNCLTQVAVDSRALGDAENSQTVLHIADDQHGGQNTLGAVVYENVRLVGDASVEMTTLDRVVDEHGLDRVDTVKIDVEGAEFAVLSGAHGILTALRPVLMMELQDDSLVAQGSSEREVVGVLSRFGYELYCYEKTRHPPLLRRFEEGKSGVAQDVVAVPVEKQALVITL